MDSIDQVNMDYQLLEASIQLVLPNVERDNDFNEHVMSQPSEEVVKSKTVTGRKI